jgi:ABC-type nitrate/sulfonate/bicarbonate transport system substrate-binding protein
MRKIFVALLTVFLFLTSADAADKVRIAFGTGASSVLFPLAQKKGFLRDEGIDAEVIQMLGNLPIAALTNGELDYNTVHKPSVRGAIQGLPIRVVACFDKGNQWVLVAGSNLKSVIELRGRTVAAGNRGQGPDTAGRRIVKHYGLEPDRDVKFTPGSSSDEGRLVSVQQGLVDATLIPIPLDLRARKLGLNILARAHEIYTYAGGGLVTTTKKIKEKPEEIKRVIKAGIKASRYIKGNADGTIQVFMDLRRMDREIAATSYEFLSKAINEDGSLPEQGFRLLIEEVKESVKVTREISFNEVSDLSILREAQREIGIKDK